MKWVKAREGRKEEESPGGSGAHIRRGPDSLQVTQGRDTGVGFESGVQMSF